MLFDEADLRKLNQLTLVANRVRAGLMKGERRSIRRGSSIEFADYRNYVSGDDLRRLDWNVYARLEKPFIKLLEEEEDLAVHILLDITESMNWGEGDANKQQYAYRMAGALGAIALSAGDRLTLTPIQASGVSIPFGPARGPQHIVRLLAYLEHLASRKATDKNAPTNTDLNRSLRDYTIEARRPGIAFLLSDMFSPNGYEFGLNQLLSRGYEVSVIQILTADELDPPLAGDLRLVDSETQQFQEVSLDAGLREAYRDRLDAWRYEIQAYCQQRGARFMQINTDVAWEKIIFYQMRSASYVK
jgi:uncharacterized protein (DUF58 family)